MAQGAADPACAVTSVLGLEPSPKWGRDVHAVMQIRGCLVGIAVQEGVQLLGTDLRRPGLTLQLHLHTTAHHGDAFGVLGCRRVAALEAPLAQSAHSPMPGSETATRMPSHAKRWCSDAANTPYAELRHGGVQTRGSCEPQGSGTCGGMRAPTRQL